MSSDKPGIAHVAWAPNCLSSSCLTYAGLAKQYTQVISWFGGELVDADKGRVNAGGKYSTTLVSNERACGDCEILAAEAC